MAIFGTNASMSTGSVRLPKRESESQPSGRINEYRPNNAIRPLVISSWQNLLQVGELTSS